MRRRTLCVLMSTAWRLHAAEGDIWDLGPPALPAVEPADEVSFPAWLPASARGTASGGTTSVVAMVSRWVVPPLAGRPAVVAVAHSNRLAQAVLLERGAAAFADGAGMLCLVAGTDPPVALPGFPAPRYGGPGSVGIPQGGSVLKTFLLPPALVAAAAGSDGLVLAYAGRQPPVDPGVEAEVVHWASCAPLEVPALEGGPAQAGTNEWAAVLAFWMDCGLSRGDAHPQDILTSHRELARFYPGVVCDTSLPEAFRLEFAADMPSVDSYDPAVVAFVTNAVDKTAPLVIAALRVLSRCCGATPEETVTLHAAADAVHAMSLDAQHPMLFRAYAAQWFRRDTPYEDFMARTDSHLKLLAVDDIRSAPGRFFPLAVRDNLRTGLTTLSTDTTVFVPGPLAGKYPDGATVGQVATAILAELEASWAAEPPRQP